MCSLKKCLTKIIDYDKKLVVIKFFKREFIFWEAKVESWKKLVRFIRALKK